MMEEVKKLNGNFDQEEFFKNGFDASLRNLLETEIFKRSFCVHASPFLIKSRLTMPFKFTLGPNKYETCSFHSHVDFIEFNLSRDLYQDPVNLNSPEMLNIYKFYVDDALRSTMNGLLFVDLSYLRINSIAACRDEVYAPLFYDDTKVMIYVTAEIELFFLVKLLLPGSANFFLGNLKAGFGEWWSAILHEWGCCKYTFEEGRLVDYPGVKSNGKSGGAALPWHAVP